jgi:hypothetical protein
MWSSRYILTFIVCLVTSDVLPSDAAAASEEVTHGDDGLASGFRVVTKATIREIDI